MEQVSGVHCGIFFTPRNREQNYCMAPECQKARKAVWQRNKMHTDPDYKADQKLSQKKWAIVNPGYWKEYRKKNPKKAQRNRMLQTIRNRRRVKGQNENIKMDPSLIAKMDARKVNIYTITDRYH